MPIVTTLLAGHGPVPILAHAAPRPPLPDCDLAILGGTVVDGDGSAQIEADVFVEGGRIMSVAAADEVVLDCTTVLDATGRVVAPGFIDTHAHGDPLEDGSFQNFLLQGATTVVLGQDGRTPGASGEEPLHLAEWMRRVEDRGLEVNVATLVGHGTLREQTGVGNAPDVSEGQLRKMQALLEDGLQAGGWGLSTGLEYVPGRYSETDELVELAKVVGTVDGVVMSHLRSEDDDRIADAIDELIRQGRHARVHISHLKIVFAKHAERACRVLYQILAAREAGIRITADVYPYLAGFADLTLIYPGWAKTEEEWRHALEHRRAALAEYLFERVQRRNGPGSILITSGDYASMTLEEAAERRGISFVEMILDEFDFGGPNAAHFIMREDVQDVFVRADGVAISTDGGPWIQHPRSWGSFPKVIEDHVLPGRLSLEKAIHKMSGLPADIVGLSDRGRLRPGAAADIVIFDLENVRSRASWTQHDLAPAGFDYIIVNGAVSAIDGEAQDVPNGQVLRRRTGTDQRAYSE